jgi:Kef-type K+ transport system membrane component KefB/Trk K+ transport system NAD-binding subunit
MFMELLASTSDSLVVFNEIALIIAFGTVVALIMQILKQPLIIGHIITGILVGPAFFNLVKSEETITVFANLGIALLLFIIGLGLNPKVIKEVGKAAVVAGMVQIMFTTFLGYMVALALGFSQLESGLIGVALAFSSTIIILKLISDKKEQTRLYAKLSVGILLIQDIVATIALLLLSSASAEGGLSGADFALLGIKASLALLVMFIISIEILPRFNKLIAGSQEFLFLFALGWGLGLASAFELVGFSLEVGALLAGVGLATQTYAQEISSRLKPLRDFFVVVFFISLGTQLVFDDVFAVVIPAVLLSAVVIIFNPIVITSALGMLGYTRKISFKVGIGMAQISEFSLVFAILAERQGKLSSETLSVLTLVGLLTIAISTYMITYADQLYVYLESHFKMFERHKVKVNQKEIGSYPIMMFGYKKGGAEYIKTFRAMKKPFVIVDYDPQIIDEIEHKKFHYIYGDATDLELLDEIGAESAKLVVSTITEHETNVFLVKHMHEINPTAVIICHSDTVEETLELYEHGASYVIMSHAIGSEKIGNFLKKKGLKNAEFEKFREKHVASLVSQVVEKPND